MLTCLIAGSRNIFAASISSLSFSSFLGPLIKDHSCNSNRKQYDANPGHLSIDHYVIKCYSLPGQSVRAIIQKLNIAIRYE
jgi:hypothetical protein